MKSKSLKSKRLKLAVMIALMLSIMLSLFAFLKQPAWAYETGDDYPWKGQSMDEYDDYLFYKRNCTSFVAWCLNSRNGVGFTNWYGGVKWSNASNWGNAARQLGIAVDNNPAIGSVAWMSSGHVAWVRGVDGDNVTVDEYNWNGDGLYHSYTWPKSHYSGFIHIKDIGAMQIADLGASFDGYLIATKPWIHIVMNKDTENVELESSNAERFTARNCWRFDRQSDGSYIITSLYNGKVLDVDGASSANGTNVQVYTRWGDDNAAQRWFLCTDGTMAPKLDPTKRLDVQGGSMVNGGNIQIYSANGTDAQFIYPYKRTTDSNDPFPTGMTIDSELTVPVGEQATVHSTFTPQNSRNIFLGIEWSSSDKSVATVDNKGVVTGIKAGKATITAVSTFNDHWTAQCGVTVGSLIQVPEISSLTVTGYKVGLSWEASPLTDENDEREYEVNVYKKDALEVPEQTFTGLTGTDLQFTVDSHGDYVVTVTAVNAADGSRSKDSSRAFIVLDEEWLYYDELPEDLPECEIQYLNHYDSIESAQSPGDGWVRGKSRKIYTDAGILYSPDPNPLQESDTLVLLGTYYYHFCNGSGRVEHYQTGSYTNETIIDNWDGRFEIVWQGQMTMTAVILHTA